MIIRIFICQHMYMRLKTYKYIYENGITLSQMRKYLMSRDMEQMKVLEIPTLTNKLIKQI